MVFPKVDPYSAKKDIERADRDEKSVANYDYYVQNSKQGFSKSIRYKQSYVQPWDALIPTFQDILRTLMKQEELATLVGSFPYRTILSGI